MQFELKRQDICHTATTQPQTLIVIPHGSEGGVGDRVVVGDTAGVVQAFCFRKGEFQQAFKTLPAPRKINCVTTGFGRTQKDKVFVAEGSVVRGYDRQGTQFFKFTTPLTADIRCLAVAESYMYAFTENAFTLFEETTERAHYAAPARINCAAIAPLSGPGKWAAVIGCQDRMLRVLEGAQVLQEICLAAVPTALAYFVLPHDPRNLHPTRKEIFYGLRDGEVGQLFLDRASHRTGAVLRSAARCAPVTAVFSGFDLTKDGVDDVVVGRDDGSVEIYDMDDAGMLQPRWEANVCESVHSIAAGCVTSTAEEYIVQTFSGAVISFTTGTPLLSLTGAQRRSTGAVAAPDALLLAALQQQVQELQLDVQDARGRLAERSVALVATQQLLPVKHALTLNVAAATCEVRIEAAAPLFCVAVLVTTPVEFLDSPASLAIMTPCASLPGSGAASIAVFRCQDATTRLVIAMRVTEGASGTVAAYVVPRHDPKTCELVTHPLACLALHRHGTGLDGDRPLAHLEVAGQFGLEEVHQWIAACVPDAPRRAAGDAGRYVLEGVLLGTQLLIVYREGWAKASSDSPCALAVLRDEITRQATRAGVRVEVMNVLEKATVVHFVGLVWPRLQEQRNRRLEAKLLTALEEVKAQEPDLSFLTKDMKRIVDRGDAIKKQSEGVGRHADSELAQLVQQVCTVHAEWSRSQGKQHAQSHLAQLQRKLHDPHSTMADITGFILSAGV